MSWTDYGWEKKRMSDEKIISQQSLQSSTWKAFDVIGTKNAWWSQCQFYWLLSLRNHVNTSTADIASCNEKSSMLIIGRWWVNSFEASLHSSVISDHILIKSKTASLGGQQLPQKSWWKRVLLQIIWNRIDVSKKPQSTT